MKTTIFLFVLLNILNINAQPTWHFTNGPFGGNIIALSSSDNVLIASTYLDRIYRSTDNGTTWESSNNGLPNDAEITCLTKIGNVFFAGTFEHGVYRSGVDGVNWVAVNNGISGNDSKLIYTFAVENNKLLVSTGEGVYITFNNGGLWTKINNGIGSNIEVISLGISGDTLFAGTLGEGLYISNNNGGVWTLKSSIFPWLNTSVTGLFANGDTIYVGAGDFINSKFNSRLFISSDRGENWQEIFDIPTEYELITSIAGHNSDIIATTDRGIWKSKDGGLTWEENNLGLTINSVNTITNKIGTLFVGTISDGVFTYTDSLNKWVPVNNNLRNVDCLSLNTYNTNILVGTKNGGILRKSLNEDSWSGINKGLPYFGLISFSAFQPIENITSIEVVDTSMFISGGYGIYSANNIDANWAVAGTGLTINTLCIKESENLYYAGTEDYGVWKSEDNVNTWFKSSTGIPGGKIIRTIEVVGDNVFAAGSGVYWSFNQGANWAQLPLFETVYQIKHIGDYLYACCRNGLYRSIDLGNNWSDIGLNEVKAITSFGSTLVVGTESDGVFYSKDDESWQSVNDGLPQGFIVSDLLSVGSNIYLATEKHGVWSLDSTELQECAFSSIEILDVGSCDTFSNTYELVLSFTYNSAADGDVQILVDGVSFPYTTNGSGIDTVSVFPTSNGKIDVDLSVRLLANINCSTGLVDAFNAPVSCDTITSLRDPFLLGITLAPNPFIENFRISFNNGDAESWEYTIVDTYGRNITDNSGFQYVNSNTVDITLNNVPTGIYFLSFMNEKKQTCYRLLKL